VGHEEGEVGPGISAKDIILHITGTIGAAGGTVMVEPLDVPGGRILVAQDPQGAFFAVLAGWLFGPGRAALRPARVEA